MAGFRLLALVLAVLGCCIGTVTGQNDPTLKYYENETTLFTVTKSLSGSFADLGAFPHWCAGNVSICNNGFTVAVWIKPSAANAEAKNIVVISNGGHAADGDGYYVTQVYGNQYEAGVKYGGNVWKVKFSLTSDEWVHLALSWSSSLGLTVYVDGLVENAETSVDVRDAATSDYVGEYGIVVGLDEYGLPLTSESRFLVSSVDVYNDISVASNLVKLVGENDSLFLGCEPSFNAQLNLTTNVSTLDHPIHECRQFCKDHNMSYAFLQDNAQCSCVNMDPQVSSPAGCVGDWKVYLVSHVKTTHTNIVLSLTSQRLSPRNYTKPGEDVLLMASINVSVDVSFSFNFNDGISVSSGYPPVSHSWSSEGDYVVTVSTTIGLIHLKKTILIKIEDVDEGQSPYLVELSGIHPTDKSKRCEIQLTVNDPVNTNCTVTYGDGSSSFLMYTDFLSSQTEVHDYAGIGQYDTTAVCSNQYGFTVDNFDFLSKEFYEYYQYIQIGMVVRFDVVGPGTFVDDLVTEVNGTAVTPVKTATQVEVQGTDFTAGSDLKVDLIWHDQLLQRKYIRAERRTPKPKINASKLAGPWNMTVNFTIEIPPGDFMALTFNYGNGQPSEVYYIHDSTETLYIPGEAEYTSLGGYGLFARVANDITSEMVGEEMSVEVPVFAISLASANVTSLSTPVGLTVDVNMGNKGPPKVVFTIDYRDGTAPKVHEYDNTDPVGFLPFSTDYTYSDWGIYRIMVTASNNISSVTEQVLVQVGQNITTIDIVSNIDRIPINGQVTFTVTCPTGSEVTYDIDFGDETSFSLPEHITGGVKTDVQTVGRVISESVVNITHTYMDTGYFNISVSATNDFSHATAPLCPTVIVDYDTTPGPQVCSIPTVSFRNIDPTSQISPAEHKRSEEMLVTVDTDLNCIKNSTANFSWKALKITIDQGTQTETQVHEICKFQETNNTLTIPPLGLPYGLYKITVTVAPVDHDLISASHDLYLRIIMSEPVAEIIGGDVQTFLIYANAILDVSASRDPDLTSNVRNGLIYDMFFLPSTDLDSAKALTLAQLKSQSTVRHTDTLYKGQTKNPLGIYEKGHVFNDTASLPDALTRYNAKISFPASYFVTDYFSFGIILYITRNNLMSMTSQIIDIRKTNQSLDDLSSLLDMARNADPDTAIRLCDGAAAAILNQEASSVEEQEKLAESTEAVVDTLGSVAKRVDNANQASKCAGAIKTMTSNKDIVSEGSRSSAADAFVNLANSTSNMEDATVDDAENFAGECLGGFDNIFPSNEDATKPKRGRRKDTSNANSNDVSTVLPYTGEMTTPMSTLSSTTVETTTLPPTTTTMATTTTTTIASTTSASGVVINYVAVGDSSIDVAENLLNNLPEKLTYDELFYYIFDDCSLFRKVMKTERVQYTCPCVSPKQIDDMKCSGTWTDQERIFATMTYLEHPDDIYDYYLIPPRFLFASVASTFDWLVVKDAVVAKSGSNALSTVADTVNNKAPEGDDKERTFNSNRLGLKVQKLSVKKNNGTKNSTDSKPKTQTMSMDVGTFNMPLDALPVSSDCPGVNTMFLGDSDNPYSFSKEKSSVGKGVLSLGYSCGGSELSVKNTAEPIEMWMSRDEKAYSSSLFVLITKWNSDIPSINYHPLNLTDKNSSIQVVLRPGKANEAYDVFVMYDSHPNVTHYDFKDYVPKDDLSMFVNVTEDELDELKYTVTVPTSMTSMNGTYWIGVKLKRGTVSISEDTTNNTYSLMNLVSGCRYWDTEGEAWSSEGCTVGPLTTKYRTQCLCTHLTSFGSDFVVAPNTIDFTNVWAKFANLNENAAVFSTVITILGIYVIGLIWARYMDKKDIMKWGATPLVDNLPTDNYHYQISVQTGMRKNAGTDSKISIILSGDDSDTGVRRLDDGKRNHLGRGSIMNFVLSVESTLGSLTFMRIWHDNAGKGKQQSWYLDQVQITDLQTGEKSFFLCDRWLAVEEDDGMVDRILPVAGLNDLIAFKHLFSSSARKKLTNEHLWVSVFSRPTRSNFTRVQRISCCVSLLFLTMISNCMFFKTEGKQENVTAIQIGPISITLQSIFVSIISTFIVFPASFIMVTFFRRCRPKKNAIMQKNQQDPKRGQKYRWKNIHSSAGMFGSKTQKTKMQKFKESMSGILSFHQKNKYDMDEDGVGHEQIRLEKKTKRKKKPWSLPHWCTYIAWVVCFLSVVGSAFFTILYSMEWGKEKSNEWLIAFVLSFFQSVIVVQPIKVLLIVAFIACILKKPELDEEDLNENIDNVLAPDEELLSKKQDPATVSAILLQRKMANSEYAPPDTKDLDEVRDLRLKEIKMEAVLKEIIIYTFFVLVIFFLSYQQRDSDSFGFGQNIKNRFVGKFEKISTIPDYWNWLNTTFIPAMYATHYSNNTEITDWQDRACINDHQTRRVGVARLRQMRVKEDTCTIQPKMKTLINHCRDEYGWTDDDTKPYLPQWQIIPEENKTDSKKWKTPWVYQSSVKLANAPYVATIATYKGGGYVSLLARQACRTKQIIANLQDNDWLDLRTRAVFMEFTFYNPNVNLFASAVFVIEYMATGSAVARVEVKIFRLLSYVGGWGLVVLLFEIIYGCFTLYFFIRCVTQVKKQRLKYFKNFWMILEFVLLCFAVACIVMYAFKHILTEIAMHSLHDRESDGFVNFQSVSLYDETYGYVMAVVVFMATIQFMKLLQFNQRMNMLGDTVKLATKDLKVFSVAFLLYFFAFTATAYLLFGQAMVTYNSIVGAAESMFAFALGSFDFEAMADAQKILGPLFFFSFIGVIYIGLMSIFLTIIGDAFTQVKANVALQSNEHEIVDFMWKRLKGLLGFT
ncbi:LOW QUALITY PROTEIN: uncharacterized protein LOC124289408 [Haliotis rubra]|uniref:LOW QUALITY PROTEIN: uncharacterized protein LOC124289408 n=1 Tax=Haliotis rubra TaxID=36100 RepID=UPI001EE571A8|nr:LOW QUALITY PROTEIN: uncharacterized protein LOC124289408 [Haliotis rubra]